jgi:CheY-like chemotaxis protein
MDPLSAQHAMPTALGGPLRLIAEQIDDLIASASDLASDDRLQHVRANVQRLTAIIAGLASCADLDSGVLCARPVPVSPWRLAQQAATGFRATCQNSRVALAVAADGQIPAQAMLPGDLLQQSLTQVLAAAGATTTDGGIRLGLDWDPRDERLLVTIEDSGSGLNPLAADVLLDGPARIEPLLANAEGMIGLGLWVAGRLIGLSGGTMRIETLAGHGTACRISLPAPVVAGNGSLSLSEPPPAFQPAVQPEGANMLAGYRVLVVDDVPSNRLLAATILKRRGAGVTLADDGDVGVERALAAERGGRAFDLILMDLRMPRLSGQRACQQLRDAGCTAPIIACSTDTSVIKPGDGFSGRLDKPFFGRDLLDLVESYGRERRRRMAG